MSQQVSVNLTKGQKVDLRKDNPALAILAIGLGWDVNESPGAKHSYDLDTVAYALRGGKLASGGDLLFYGLAAAPGKPFDIFNGALAHSGDNLTGAGDGDDETIIVDLNSIPADVNAIGIAVSLYDAATRGQNFGQVKKAFARCYDGATQQEICKFDLSEDMSAFTSVIVGKLYRHDSSWKFEAVGQGMTGDINDMIPQVEKICS